MKLSILIPTIPERKEFLSELLTVLQPQITDDVELIIYCDNKQLTLGAKRNKMIEMASGEYVIFIDDDDLIYDDYVKKLLQAIEQKPDVVTFKGRYYNNGQFDREFRYTIKIEADYNTPECYYRLPNGICCWRKELIRGLFDDITLYEDAEFAKKASKLARSEVFIDKTLYQYLFDSKNTSTQQITIN